MSKAARRSSSVSHQLTPPGLRHAISVLTITEQSLRCPVNAYTQLLVGILLGTHSRNRLSQKVSTAGEITTNKD